MFLTLAFQLEGYPDAFYVKFDNADELQRAIRNLEIVTYKDEEGGVVVLLKVKGK